MKTFRLDYSQYEIVFDLIADEHEVIIGQMCYGISSHLH
jgi:hypothetical protein